MTAIEFYNDFDSPGLRTCTRAVQGEEVQITVRKYDISLGLLPLVESDRHECWVRVGESRCRYKLYRPALTCCSS